MSKPKQPGRLIKLAVAAAVSILVFAASYGLLFIVPARQTLAFIQTVKDYGPYLAFVRWGVLAILYGIVLLKVNALLAREKVSTRQKQFLSGLRWQTLAFLLLMEWLLGPHGLTQLGH